MNVLHVFLLILLLPLLAGAQDIPDTVERSFARRFAQAENVIWDTDEDGDHIAMFLLSGKDMSAQFHEDGEWVSTTTYIDQAEIPRKIQSTVAKQFSDYEIYDVARVETPGGVYFEAMLESENDALLVQINADGGILKREILAIDVE